MKTDTRDGSASIVSRNIVVEGEIQGSENLTVEGRVKGLVKIDGDILVGETGVVEADMEAGSVVIRGKVTGDVTVQHILEVHPGGELYGSIRARLIHIKEGAVFEGRAQMIRSPAIETTSVGFEQPEALVEEGTAP
jgi:cytoskeletal protein CcmA (bactofilin family)